MYVWAVARYVREWANLCQARGSPRFRTVYERVLACYKVYRVCCRTAPCLAPRIGMGLVRQLGPCTADRLARYGKLRQYVCGSAR